MAVPFRDLIHQIYNVKGIIQWGGTALVCAIIFAETGLFVGFFLPGDSLLVTAGVFAGAGHLELVWLLVPVSLCAIAGDQLGYLIGRKAGANLYRRSDSRFFRKKHLQAAHDFYERHGAPTIILARFVPIIRTFCPPVAGAAQMKYSWYLSFDILGGIFWVCGMILVGYTLGATIPHIDQQIQWVIIAVIVLSFVPAAIQALRMKRASRHASRNAQDEHPVSHTR